MFSQTAEYALRAVVWLAANTGAPQTNVQIAKATRVPRGYLSKIMQTLVRRELVRSQRGLGGGFALTRDPRQLSVLDVLEAVDPLRRISSCPLGLPTHAHKLCPLHARLDAALAFVQEAFRKSTIADLLSDDTPSNPLCAELTVSRPGAAKAGATSGNGAPRKGRQAR
jgi:Rrf2 family protein